MKLPTSNNIFRWLYLLHLILPLVPTSGQDWKIFNSGWTYNYGMDGDELIGATIFTDSSLVLEGDSVHFLNRIIKDWEEGPKISGFYLNAHYNAPQFLLEQVRETDSSNIFEIPERFEILKKYHKNKAWEFDKQNDIQAWYVNDTIMNLFNTSDSIRVIALSGADTILLSKNYGIIRFDEIYEGTAYNLLGIENNIGVQNMDYKDFYDFQPGDVFVYSIDNWDVDSYPNHKWIRITIQERKDEAGQILYKRLVQTREITCGFGVGCEELLSSYKDQLIVNDQREPIVNGYHGQMISPYSYTHSYYYNIARLTVDTSYMGLLTKTSSRNLNWQAWDVFRISDTTAFLLERLFIFDEDHTTVKYAAGLGQVLIENEGFEWSYTKELIAFKKGDIEFGDISDDLFLEKEDQVVEDELKVFPLPADEYLIIENTSGKSIGNTYFLDMNGRLIKQCSSSNKISVKELFSGIYYLGIELDGVKHYTRIIVRH